MRRKIIGVTVGTPHDPAIIESKIKPVKTVNDIKPDENGNVLIPITDGEDGFSPTISVSTITDGHRMTITDKNGTKNVDVLDGKITDNDRAEFSEYIVSELAKRGQLKPENAQSVEWLLANGDTTKLYVLTDKTDPNCGFIYANVYTEVTVEPTNAIPTATDTDRKTIYNGKGYKEGMRINSSGVVTDASGKAV